MTLPAKQILVLITGGRQGIGKHLADTFLKNGATVIITSRSFSFTPGVVLKKNTIIEQHLDVTDEDSVNHFFAWLNAQNQKLNILVNNAGTGCFKPIEAISLSEWN